MDRPLDTTRLQAVIPAAKYLLGCHIVREYNGQRLVGKIVETEAYHQSDPASHSFKGNTPRTAAMFGSAGFAYVYFTYGMHWCMNVTCGPVGEGAAVLIRAIEPLEGITTMRQLRHNASLQDLTNGPAKLAQALAIDKKLYGHDLHKPPLQIFEGQPVAEDEITVGTRIGIRQAATELLRFYITGNSFVSKR
jgi:DNA-3-methyladenine glycosylase